MLRDDRAALAVSRILQASDRARLVRWRVYLQLLRELIRLRKVNDADVGRNDRRDVLRW